MKGYKITDKKNFIKDYIYRGKYFYYYSNLEELMKHESWIRRCQDDEDLAIMEVQVIGIIIKKEYCFHTTGFKTIGIVPIDEYYKYPFKYKLEINI